MIKSIIVDKQDIRNYNWGERLPPHTVQYADVINFERSSTKQNRCCVLCGDKESEKECMIPKQNKGVCRRCDSTYWLLKKLGVVVKFCKGCKLFFSLADFDGKPNTTKCGTCRRRGRDNYHGKMERKRCMELEHGHDMESEAALHTVDGGYTSGTSSGDSDISVLEDVDAEEFSMQKKRQRVNTPSSRKAQSLHLGQTGGEGDDSVVALLLGMDSQRSRERLGAVSPLQSSPNVNKEQVEGAALSLLLAAATMELQEQNATCHL